MDGENRCEVDGCSNPQIMRGVCTVHYSRLKKTGSYDLKPPSNTRNARRMLWKSINHRHPQGTGWRDFEDFDASVGLRPASNYVLVKLDEDQLIGPANFQWKLRSEVIPRKSKHDWSTKAGRSAAKKATRRPNARFEGKLRSYGLSVDEYTKMLAAQNGVCAVCKQPETQIISGRLLSLSIDHCHGTGLVRGLLCNACNRGLGFFCDDPDRLIDAAKYLSTSKSRNNVVQLKIVEK